MRVLVWQWGRRGAGPRFAVELAAGLAQVDRVTALLSLSAQAELLSLASKPLVDLAQPTYTGLPGFTARMLTLPLQLPRLLRRLQALSPDLAICAMPAPLDPLMATALRLARIPYWVLVHDADSHPGDGLPFQMALQRHLLRHATGLVALSSHVAGRLREQGADRGRKLILSGHPPFAFGPPPPPPRQHGGKLRLLFFGRLLPYKGLDLLAEALLHLGPQADLTVRIAGAGPDSAALTALRAMPHVTVDRRWIPEAELGAMLAWADAVVLPYREASQSGVAAAAVAAGRWVVATEIGGLAEQLGHSPLARLCPPTAAALAAALQSLLTAPPTSAPPPEPGWAEMARAMLGQMVNIK